MRVGDLRKWLDDNEKLWTEDDLKWLGEFDDQEIYCPHYAFVPSLDDKNKEEIIFKGWDKDNHIYWDVTGLGIFFDIKE